MTPLVCALWKHPISYMWLCPVACLHQLPDMFLAQSLWFLRTTRLTVLINYLFIDLRRSTTPILVFRDLHFVVQSWSHLCLGFQRFTLCSKELILRLTSGDLHCVVKSWSWDGNLAAQNRKSHEESRAWNHRNFHNEKDKNDSLNQIAGM